MQVVSTFVPSLTLLSQFNPCCQGGIPAPILQTRKLRCEEVKAFFVQVHEATVQHRRGRDPGLRGSDRQTLLDNTTVLTRIDGLLHAGTGLQCPRQPFPTPATALPLTCPAAQEQNLALSALGPSPCPKSANWARGTSTTPPESNPCYTPPQPPAWSSPHAFLSLDGCKSEGTPQPFPSLSLITFYRTYCHLTHSILDLFCLLSISPHQNVSSMRTETSSVLSPAESPVHQTMPRT